MPADELESLVLSVVRGLVDNAPFWDAVVKQMKGNSTSDTKQLDNDLRDLKGNLAKATNELENLIRIHSRDDGISGSEVLTNMIKEREEARASIKAKISSLERERERIDSGKVDRKTMQGILTDYLSLYETFDKDHKRQLNQILFSAIVSYLKAGSTEGEIELRIRGNGVIKKTWEDIKKGNQKVRTSGSLGSPRHTKTRTTSSCEYPSKSAILLTVRRQLRSQKTHSTPPSHSPQPPSPDYRIFD